VQVSCESTGRAVTKLLTSVLDLSIAGQSAVRPILCKGLTTLTDRRDRVNEKLEGTKLANTADFPTTTKPWINGFNGRRERQGGRLLDSGKHADVK
jgi:hypothetical protein